MKDEYEVTYLTSLFRVLRRQGIIMYICMYVFVCICMYLYVLVCICMYVCMYVDASDALGF